MVHVSNDQISFRRILTLIHLVRALLDCDAVRFRNTRISSASFCPRISWNAPISIYVVFMPSLSPVQALMPRARDGPKQPRM